MAPALPNPSRMYIPLHKVGLGKIPLPRKSLLASTIESESHHKFFRWYTGSQMIPDSIIHTDALHMLSGVKG